MFDFKNDPEPSIEDLKISELTVAQFRQVMRECLSADRNRGRETELARQQALGMTQPGRPVW